MQQCWANHPIYREVEYNDLRERTLYSREVNDLREYNNTFAKEDGIIIRNHQDGDFKLEERVKMMKRLSPKGKMDRKMWQRVARGMDDVDKVIKHGRELLHMPNEEASRIIVIENEVVKWHASLQNSGYLAYHKGNVRNIHGRSLNPELCDFVGVLKSKREKYFKMARETDLESIRYENLVVMLEDNPDDEISPYNSEDEDIESDHNDVVNNNDDE